ncbi:MAG: tRNA (adenosine(37)-N6)-threonylcarbamoyltransferase complex ATPase subunit type 1 TsaE [Bacteroidales bacterium]|nr:tRNA (adenosine(37)-N6)-threonylcarbamoyltransferase complex ATPase subunit type 1 TsaE [Bacteroidales bacterium]MBR5299745.1 tRNA (adenosine(37)-N6)-threonylcarbamoyltransferase complex ATPase subunit type 1 TsaE [Bacteroidales bacterium]
MKHEVIIRDTADLDRAAAEFLEKIGDNTLVAFFAPMGAGKTTFTTALCKVLGVTDPVGSPTFAIVNEYLRADGDYMYHFDFYRINKLSEAIEIGLDDYLYSGCLCIMEWPENVEELLPEDTLRVTITVNPDLSRTLSWEA